MNTRSFLTGCLLIAALFSRPSPVSAQDDASIKQAVAAAESFLSLLDNGKYEESWDASAEAFRKAVSKEQWKAAAGQVRGSVGSLSSRKLMSGADAPKAGSNAQGEFVVVKFQSAFSKLPNAIETVSPMRDTDGKYRVSGYFVKPGVSEADKAAAALPPKAGFSDDEIKVILRERIEVAKRGVGIVVGLIDENGTRIVSVGKPSVTSDKPLDGDAIFEIGSITKTFTAILLADMVARGEVKLDDPISKYLPASVKTPVVKGKQITLEQLSRHTSGLPRLPSNMNPKDPGNPYADYTVAQLYEFLNGYKTVRPFGAYTEYSNLGVGLLGHILALRAGTDYETLVRSRILAPLKMDSTAITLTPAMREKMTTGHYQTVAVPYWDLPTLAGAGALRSSTNDMLKYLAANVGFKSGLAATADVTTLLAAMQRTQRNTTDTPDMGYGLGWSLNSSFDKKIVMHGGGTGGFMTFVAFEPLRKRGVVVLSNSNSDISDIALHLLDSRRPLTKLAAAKTFQKISVDPKSFDAFVGTYEIDQGSTMVISREGDRLFSTVTGLGKIEMLPYEPMSFFGNGFDAQVTFVAEAGKVTRLMLNMDGRSIPVKRIK
ncbi:MAG: serine hydrolase [Rhodocyclaceae bacterium]|nr:serine hydrolase [Rhodocyclaceae bacterium]